MVTTLRTACTATTAAGRSPKSAKTAAAKSGYPGVRTVCGGAPGAAEVANPPCSSARAESRYDAESGKRKRAGSAVRRAQAASLPPSAAPSSTASAREIWGRSAGSAGTAVPVIARGAVYPSARRFRRRRLHAGVSVEEDEREGEGVRGRVADHGEGEVASAGQIEETQQQPADGLLHLAGRPLARVSRSESDADHDQADDPRGPRAAAEVRDAAHQVAAVSQLLGRR